MTSLEPVCQFLRDFKVAKLYDERHVVVLHERMTLNCALRALADCHILSAPVISGKGQHLEKPVDIERHADGDVLGFMDVRDILIGFLDELPDVQSVVRMSMQERMHHLEGAGVKYGEKVVADVNQYGSDGNFLHSGRTQLSLWEVAYTTLLHPSHKSAKRQRTGTVHHRIALFNSKYQITKIISQTDVMKVLYENKARLSGCLGVKIMDVPGLCSRHIITMQAHQSALEALTIMQQYNISAVAVLDPDGKLLGNFSMTAMRTIVCEHFGALALPVAEFLSWTYGLDYRSSYHGAIAEEISDVEDTAAAKFVRCSSRKLPQLAHHSSSKPMFLSEDATFEDYLDLVVHRKVHRAYIVDDGGKPVAVATLTDCLYAFASEYPQGRPAYVDATPVEFYARR